MGVGGRRGLNLDPEPYIQPHLGVQVYMFRCGPWLWEMQACKLVHTRTSSLAWAGGKGGLTGDPSGFA